MITPATNAQDLVTVLVVDDDPLIRRSVSRLIRSVGFTVKTFSSPTDFLQHPLPAGPACVLLDMCMEGMTGLEVQDALRQQQQQGGQQQQQGGQRGGQGGQGGRRVPVVFLSGHGSVPIVAAGFKHGAADFLEKPFRAKDLLAAVHRAIEHDRTQCADRADHDELRRRFERLTPREREVMALVCCGLLNKQAAAELGISEKTIKVHRARVMEKMETESLAALVLLAERLGLDRAPTTAAAAS